MLAFVIKTISRIVIGVLWARFVLVLFNITGGVVVAGIFQYSTYLRAPFQGMFRDVVVGGRWTVESTTLLAIVAYAFLEFMLVHLVQATHRDDY